VGPGKPFPLPLSTGLGLPHRHRLTRGSRWMLYNAQSTTNLRKDSSQPQQDLNPARARMDRPARVSVAAEPLPETDLDATPIARSIDRRPAVNLRVHHLEAEPGWKAVYGQRRRRQAGGKWARDEDRILRPVINPDAVRLTA